MLSFPEYLAHVDADAHLLAAAAARGLDARVPGCPGWSVIDLIDHVAKVYSSRIDIVEQKLADRWPPRRPRPDGVDPLDWFRTEAARMVELLGDADPAQPATSFTRDRTVGFWIRRMAHETVIHRIDAEQAHRYESVIDPELAVDGVAEMFEVFITRHRGEFIPGNEVVRVLTGDSSWTARLGRLVDPRGDETPKAVLESGAEPDAVLTGEPERVLLWMWGRASSDEVMVSGDADLTRRFREVCSV